MLALEPRLSRVKREPEAAAGAQNLQTPRCVKHGAEPHGL